MKVLVTGGCGFLGSHVCEYYLNRGDQVIAYDNLTKYELLRTNYATDKARNYNLNFLKNRGVDIVVADICNYPQLLETTQGCDFIVHTAAQPAMTISIDEPDMDFATNVQGTYNVLRVARDLNIPVASCSSIHVYGNGINETLVEGETRYTRDPAGINELHPLLEGTVTPLHASKRAAEIYLQAFVDTYGVQAANFRLTGLYGPRQFGGEDHGWVANFSIRAVMDWPITLFGTGKQVRDILYASDAVTAFHAFYETRAVGTYNIGGGPQHAISLQECIDLIGDILGRKPQLQLRQKRLGDLWYFVCDTTRARQAIGWQAQIAPAEGVARLLTWLLENTDCFRA